MDALTAFSDAFHLLRKGSCDVFRLNGANSVWLAVRDGNPVFILKYFEEGDHGHNHFETEAEFLTKNDGFAGLPRVFTLDMQRRCIVTEYVHPDPQSDFCMDALFDITNEGIPNLSLPQHFHSAPTGILSWWKDGVASFGLAEKLVLEVAHSQSSLAYSVDFVQSAWAATLVVHGDLKLQNIILATKSVCIIDWESVGLGPRYWDLAGLIQSLLLEALLEKKMSPWISREKKHLISQIERATEQTKHGIAARLIQSAIEMSQGSDEIPAFAVDALQMAHYASQDDWSFLRGLLQ